MVVVDVLTFNEKEEMLFYDGDKSYTGPFVFMFFCENGTVTFELKNSKSLASKIENVIDKCDQYDYIEIPIETPNMKFLIGNGNYYVHIEGSKNYTVLFEIKKKELEEIIDILKEY